MEGSIDQISMNTNKKKDFYFFSATNISKYTRSIFDFKEEPIPLMCFIYLENSREL